MSVSALLLISLSNFFSLRSKMLLGGYSEAIGLPMARLWRG